MAVSTPAVQIPWTPRHLASKIVRAMEDYREDVGARMKLLRESRNMSQEDAAHLVGVAVKTWHNWESGKRSPYESNWQRIADAFEVDVGPIRGQMPAPLGLDADEGLETQLDRMERKLDKIITTQAEAIQSLDERLAHLVREALIREREESQRSAANGQQEPESPPGQR